MTLFVSTLSGRIEADNLAELQRHLVEETKTTDVALDLKAVALINRGTSQASNGAGDSITRFLCRSTAFRP